MKNWVAGSFPANQTIGEAWLLSDRTDHTSRVANGRLKGRTLHQLMTQSPDMILGEAASRFTRFPLLIKYLDVVKMLSVQVHPADENQALIPPGETSKTEAWLILEAKLHSRIYAGLAPDATKSGLRHLSPVSADRLLAQFSPQPGECILVEAGTVHSLGDGIVVLEVQQNSDVTFRLYDWDHIDPQSSQPRPLQIEQALQCIDMTSRAVRPTAPLNEIFGSVSRDRLLDCRYFRMVRITSSTPFGVGTLTGPTVLVCIKGAGDVEHACAKVGMSKGSLILLPAALAKCRFRPASESTLIEITLPTLAT